MKKRLFLLSLLCLLSLSLCLSGCQSLSPGSDAPSPNPDLLVKSDLKSYLITNVWIYHDDSSFRFFEDDRVETTTKDASKISNGTYALEGEILHIDILDPQGGMQETFQYDQDKGAFMQIDVQTTHVTDQGLFRQ